MNPERLLSKARRIVPVLAALLALSTPVTARAAGVPGGVWWGATIGAGHTGTAAPYDLNAIDDFATKDADGKQPALLNWFTPWHSSANCGGDCAFPQTQAVNTWRHGQIPVISWGSQSLDVHNSPAYSNASIIAGSQDAYIHAWARAAKAFGKPFFLRFDWEMNGTWFNWGTGWNHDAGIEQRDADYVAMWRHVHDIFTQEGATNVNWVWCGVVDNLSNYGPLQQLYPGDAYVDWTSLDGYNAEHGNWDGNWHSFYGLYQHDYGAISSVAPSKPLLIGEVATTDWSGDSSPGHPTRSSWITDLLTNVPTQLPLIHAFVYFDDSQYTQGHTDWPLATNSVNGATTPAQDAFATGIASPIFPQGNALVSATTTKIAPPRIEIQPASLHDAAHKQRWVFPVSETGAMTVDATDGTTSTSTPLGGEPVALGTTPAAALGHDGPIVYYSGADGTIWSYKLTGGTWVNNQPSGFAAVAPHSSPKITTADTRYWVTWVATDGNVTYSEWSGTGWSVVSSELGGQPAMVGTSPSAASNGKSAPTIFYTGADGRLWYFTYGTPWRNYARSTSIERGTSPAAVQDGSDYWIAFTASDQHVHALRYAAGAWSSGDILPGGVAVAVGTSPVVAAKVQAPGSAPPIFYESSVGAGRGLIPSSSSSGPSWSDYAYSFHPLAYGTVIVPQVASDGRYWLDWTDPNGAGWEAQWNGSAWTVSAL